MDTPVLLLSLIVFLPTLGALVIAFMPKNDAVIQMTTVAFCAATLVVSLLAFGYGDSTTFSIAQGSMQSVFNVSWIPSFDIYYYMGVDGISLPLVVLTAAVSTLAAGASFSIKKQVKGYSILFLLLVTGMLGVFMALDFFLFYVFWEVMLLPMYFLIGVWGGPRREYAAIKFFLYTLLGSVLMLVALLMIYFNSDLRALAEVSDFYGDESAAVAWDELHVHPDVEAKLGRARLMLGDSDNSAELLITSTPDANEQQVSLNFEASDDPAKVGVTGGENGTYTIAFADKTKIGDLAEAINSSPAGASVSASVAEGSEEDAEVSPDSAPDSLVIGSNSDAKIHTFNLLALAAVGQHTDAFTKYTDSEGNVHAKAFLGVSLSVWAFVLLLIGFLIKVPAVPVHTWLPDAHVEAPTPISMILAGVLLKMGGYGIIRICYPICPEGGYELAYVICLIGLISMVYGAFAAMAQTDFKRLVAYSSVSHMGYVVLGLGVWSIGTWAPETMYNGAYWNMGIKGAMFQMIGHGISSAGMFFMVGVVYDRVHHRNLNEFGGLFGRMPLYTALSMGIFFAGLGLPGLCGFIGEVFVVLSIWKFSILMAVIAAAVVILTAGYILWAIQRVYLGAEYKGPHEEELIDIGFAANNSNYGGLRELAIAGTLFVFAILFGVFPHFFALQFMDATIDRQVEQLADWTKKQDIEELQAKRAEADENSNEAANAAEAAMIPELTPAVVRPVSARLKDEAKLNQLGIIDNHSG